MRAAALLMLVAGCATDFETPSIVLDLRVLGAAAEPAEVVADFDIENPAAVDLPDVSVCALVADPGATRRLEFVMNACQPGNDGRCVEEEGPILDVGSGTVDDPDLGAAPVALCGTVASGGSLLALLEASVAADSLLGFGGIAIQIVIAVRPEGGGEADTVYASKRVVYAPRLPAERVGNANPTLVRVDGALPDNGERDRDFVMPLGRCADPDARRLPLGAGERIRLAPVEPDGAREDYLLPTFDGGAREFTENLTYAWYATAGDWSAENTGGPKDIVGNEPELDTTWRAPRDVGEVVDVPMWLVQRDERGGQSWYEMCVRVRP